MILVLSAVIVSGWFSSAVYAEVPSVSTYDVTEYSSANGIPTGEANAVVQTPDGYLWVGGYGGLLRYDGRTFEQYSGVDSGLTSYSIRSLWVSSNGTLWVGSNDQGPFYYDGRTFHAFPVTDGRASPSVRCFCEDARGRIWVGSNDGLRVIENGAARYVDFSAFGHDNSIIYTLSSDSSGRIWGVDYAGALFAIDTADDSMPYYLLPGQYWDEDLYAYSALVSKDGKIYVGTNDPVLLCLSVSEKGISCESIDAGTLSGINALVESGQGGIWVGGDFGAGFYKDGQFTDLSYLEGLEHINGITEDYEYTIWAASVKRGLLKIDRTKLSSLTKTSMLKDSEVYAVCYSGDRVYIGAENGVVVTDRTYQVKEDPICAVLENYQVHAIAADLQGALYFGTFYGGLFHYDPQSGTTDNIAVDGNRIRSVRRLSDGTMAVGTNAGLSLVRDGQVVESYNTGEVVLCTLENSDGSLLLGTDGKGIRLLKNGTIEPYGGMENGLSGGVILRMEHDSSAPGMLFVSCGYDIFHGNASGFSRCADLSAYSGSILDIFSEGDDLWLLKSCGIIRIPREILLRQGRPESVELDYYDIADGLPGTIVANSWSTYENQLFSICTSNGVGLLDTSNIPMNMETPKCEVSAITFSDGSVWDGSTQLVLDKDLTRITFSLAALTFTGSDPAVSYYLEGLEDSPITTTISRRHTAEYTNLKKGTYRFHFMVFNSDGVPSEEVVIGLEKQPKFSETIWPYVLVIALTILVASAYGLIKRNEMLRKQELYKTLTDQTIATISGAVDAKDPYTCGHSQRVAELSVKIGKKVGLSEEDLERLRYIALLHDIGKIGVPDDILKKPSRLTDEEFAEIRKHVVIGGEILSNFTVLKDAAEGALYHHERYGGGGYSTGLKGTEIPFFARIIGVADAMDAMNSSRCYRAALPEEVIISEIEKGKGTQFDPVLAEKAIEVLHEEFQEKEKVDAEEKRA